MFIYDQIQVADMPPGTFAQVGLNAGDGINFATVPGSGTADIINITTTSNIGVPGVYMFRVDQQSVILPSGKCLQLYVHVTQVIQYTRHTYTATYTIISNVGIGLYIILIFTYYTML